MEATISILQEREDREGDLPEEDLVDLRRLLPSHHSLLQQQEIFWK